MHFNNQTEEKDVKTLGNEETDVRNVTEKEEESVNVINEEKPEVKEEEKEEEPVVDSENKPTEQEETDETETVEEPVKEETETTPTTESEKPKTETESQMTDVEKEAEEALAQEMAQYEETFRNYKHGEIIDGTIVGINEKEVLVDISYKSEGSIPIGEFSNVDEIVINQKIKVFVNKVENNEGKVSLSKKNADFLLALNDLKKIHEENEIVSGVIRQRVKGGMIVDIKGLNTFLPGSHISIKPIPNLDQFIGKELKFRIINIDEEKRNIIVSRKRVLEEEQEEKIKYLLDKIEVGAELDGEVKNITDYGSFIDLGGIDGLLHITDMSWGHVNHPSEMLNIGDKVKVKVIGYEAEDTKVSLGLKQLVPHPWENIELKYEEGTKVDGKVVNLTHYGAFVELEPGVEGLVHVSEMSWTKKVNHPKQLLNIGEKVSAIVLSVNKEEKKISLGIKQMEANPWLVIDERYPIGTAIKGKIKSITSFGAFVELEDDIDGLIHISDISWTKRIYHPKEVFKKGQEIEAVILSIDKHLHRIALGIKQMSRDPWESLDSRLPINTEINGLITKLIPKGVLVELNIDGDLIEGFVPISHLAIPRLERPEFAFSIGDEIPMKVIELDMENRRLILSIKAYFFSREREALHEFLKDHEPEIREQRREKEESHTVVETKDEEVMTVVETKDEEDITVPETITDEETKTVVETIPDEEVKAATESIPEEETDIAVNEATDEETVEESEQKL